MNFNSEMLCNLENYRLFVKNSKTSISKQIKLLKKKKMQYIKSSTDLVITVCTQLAKYSSSGERFFQNVSTPYRKANISLHSTT